MLKLGYIIVYVKDVEQACDFYESAFSLQKGLIHESRQYAEMKTGETTLAFVSEALSIENGISFIPHQKEALPCGIELAFVTKDVEETYKKAIQKGAFPLKEPHFKPWGQRIAYVRDLNGVLVEICSPL